MDPNSGRLYTPEQVAKLDAESRARLVELRGKPEDIERVSRATAHYADMTGQNREKRRAASKAARKARRNNR